MSVQVTRREFLTAVGALSLTQAMLGQRDVLEARLATDPMRPQFHLLPARNWMNDPNGPIYYMGRYHMFFQYNPLAAVWGDMSWNHAVSLDMIHWRHLPLSLTPTPGGPDSYGCFSGSAIPIRGDQKPIQETQCLAWSDDPMLVKWTKDPEPIVARPPEGLKITGFRDPSAWKSGHWYYMTVGSGVEDVGGCVLLYRSKDLKSWEYLHPLISGKWNGSKTTNPCDDGEMWECPEFFALGDGHVLIYSTMGRVVWESGVLDQATMTFVSKQMGELDWGAFYAPKTQLDAQGRRILWGWSKEQRNEAAMKAAGWSGMMSLPRLLSLDAEGRLTIELLPALSQLRTAQVSVDGTRVVLPNATGEVLCTGKLREGFTFTMSDGTAEFLKISYEPQTHTFHADGHTIALKAGDLPTLHAYVDGSVVETILGRRVGLTKRFYYSETTAPEIDVTFLGAGLLEMHAWKIAPITNDRLTTSKHT